MSKHFTTFQVCKALDIKFGRFREWNDRRYVTPDVPSSGRGKGRESLWSVKSIYLVGLFAYLTDRGFGRGHIAMLVDGLKRNPDLLSKEFLTIHVNKDIPEDLLSSFHSSTKISVPNAKEPHEGVFLTFPDKTMDGRPGGFDEIYVLNLKKFRDRIDRELQRIKK